MPAPLRSKQGCWTCRLRKKKCDETRPSCSSCRALELTCHGFGPKPNWMDGAEKEKSMMVQIKESVKLSRRGRFEKAKEATQNTHVHPRPSIGNPTHPESIARDLDPLPMPVDENCSVAISPSKEAVLLMHFLDYVVCLQYPLYRFDPAEGGRGWLLALLLNTQPLYHAVLAFSTYHQQATSLSTAITSYSTTRRTDREQQVFKCLHEFQKSLSQVRLWLNAASPRESTRDIGYIAAVVQSVFFELFAGEGDKWQAHLDLASGLLIQNYTERPAAIGGLMKLSRPPDELPTDLAPIPEPLPQFTMEEEATIVFLHGSILWLDIISCITTGKSPRTLPLLQDTLSITSQGILERIMGVENWVMFQIGSIASLNEEKTRALEQGGLDATKIETTANGIRNRLQRGLAEAFLKHTTFSDAGSNWRPTQTPKPSALINRVFALAALVYLEVVLHGFQLDMTALQPILSEAIMIMTTRIEPRLYSAMVWPSYILGCASRQEDRGFFRQIFSSPPLLDHSLKHRAQILPLLEAVWRQRDMALSGLTWEGSLCSLPYKILLL